jgi:hypothetical protein
VSYLLQFFTWDHLPEHLRAPSKLIGEVAHTLAKMSDADIDAEVDLINRHQAASLLSGLLGEWDRSSPCNPESTWCNVKIAEAAMALAKPAVNVLDRDANRELCLRKLLEAKDCAVRALLYREPGSGA